MKQLIAIFFTVIYYAALCNNVAAVGKSFVAINDNVKCVKSNHNKLLSFHNIHASTKVTAHHNGFKKSSGGSSLLKQQTSQFGDEVRQTIIVKTTIQLPIFYKPALYIQHCVYLI